jgi:3-methylcrotonyl-CoA carboxylase alpha subunit
MTLETKGVPMIPGYHGSDQETELLLAHAETIGYPLLVKASAGGGGKGMKIVEQRESLQDAIDSAKREAKNSFGDEQLLLEKYLIKPRHIEVQILADQYGCVKSLFERDCSIQRRHQKVLEEAPAANLPEDIRQAMWRAAEAAAQEIGYEGAGTVEFILSASGEFYFLEMNTRLQVEHPVTEFITGIDLVEWQLRIAQGEPLTLNNFDEPNGHAIEVRLYAEDPSDDFKPMVGQLDVLTYPEGEGIRIDTGVTSGATVSSFYDPMLAKVIVHAPNRERALNKLQRVLSETRCFGMTTNLEFLRKLSHHDDVIANRFYTRWLDDFPQFYQTQIDERLPLLAAIASVAHLENDTPQSTWQRHQGWRLSGESHWMFSVSEQSHIDVTRMPRNQWQLQQDSIHWVIDHLAWRRNGEHYGLMIDSDGLSQTWDFYPTPQGIWLDNGKQLSYVQWWQAEKAHEAQADSLGHAVAVLPGTVTALYKSVGDSIEKGEKIISFEAMKMETTLVAEISGTVQSLSWQVGDQIAEGDSLYAIEADAEAGDGHNA